MKQLGKMKITEYNRAQIRSGMALGAAIGVVHLGIEIIDVTVKVLKAVAKNKREEEK